MNINNNPNQTGIMQYYIIKLKKEIKAYFCLEGKSLTKTVEAYPVIFSGFESVSLYVHKEVAYKDRIAKNKWRVTEKSTGLSVGEGSTRTLACDEAASKLTWKTKQEVHRVINNQNKIAS